MLNLQMMVAYIIDYLAADPNYPLHPVRMIGFFIGAIERLLTRCFKGRMEYLAGLILTVLTVSITFFFIRSIILLSVRLGPVAAFASNVFFIYSAISPKEMSLRAREVKKRVENGDILTARKELSCLVGRETKDMGKDGIIAALIETVSENITDGSLAPLFYAAIGGAPLAMTYRAINTLDSMLGYKNSKYLRLGFFPARLDDLVNYIPARLTGIFMLISAIILKFDWPAGLKIVFKDSRKHASPNAGIPEAFIAGMLGIELGGPSIYGDALVKRPRLGNGGADLSVSMVDRAIKIHQLSAVIALISFIIIRTALKKGGVLLWVA